MRLDNYFNQISNPYKTEILKSIKLSLGLTNLSANSSIQETKRNFTDIEKINKLAKIISEAKELDEKINKNKNPGKKFNVDYKKRFWDKFCFLNNFDATKIIFKKNNVLEKDLKLWYGKLNEDKILLIENKHSLHGDKEDYYSGVTLLSLLYNSVPELLDLVKEKNISNAELEFTKDPIGFFKQLDCQTSDKQSVYSLSFVRSKGIDISWSSEEQHSVMVGYPIYIYFD